MIAEYTQKEIILHVEGLQVVYDDKVIIDNVNFTERNVVRPGTNQGQTIAFLGRSGRGKSTLFRSLTGIEKPTKGSVLIPDHSKPPENGSQPAKAVSEGDVGFVDQKYTLFRNKTVTEALKFALRKSTLSPSEKNDKINQYLDEWGLTKVRDHYPNQLSGGQRQRTAILEQLLCSVNFMILDEPFSGLDVGNIQNVKEAFDRIGKSHELNTTIFSTHDIELAVELADSIHIIGYPRDHEGKLIPSGTILKSYDLKEMGLAWNSTYHSGHMDLVKLIKEDLLNS
ncbi:MAG: ATP-binding cassette domain-containing protein [Sphingobacteriales bacterium]